MSKKLKKEVEKMKCTILVLTNSKDGEHSNVVITKLRNRGEKVFRFDVDKIGSSLKVELLINSGKFECTLFDENKNILRLSEVKSIWYRRPNRFNLNIKDPVQKNFCESELLDFLNGLWFSTDGVLWLNNPYNLEKAKKKVLQLNIAREIGLKIPKTLITNNSKRVEEFFMECNGKIIYKTMKESFLGYEDKGFHIPTTLLQREHLQKLILISSTPSLFQEYIEKSYEVRITIVGNRIFAAKIDSQSNPLTSIDWRHPDLINKIPYEPISIPEEVTVQCHRLMDVLGIQFGALDFIVNKNNEYVFLEINPNGQWYWIEHLTGLLISDALCDILASGISSPKEVKHYDC